MSTTRCSMGSMRQRLSSRSGGICDFVSFGSCSLVSYFMHACMCRPPGSALSPDALPMLMLVVGCGLARSPTSILSTPPHTCYFMHACECRPPVPALSIDTLPALMLARCCIERWFGQVCGRANSKVTKAEQAAKKEAPHADL